VRLDELRAPAAWRLVPQVDRLCLEQLGAASSWVALAPTQVLRAGADTAALDAMNPALRISLALLLLLDTADTSAHPFLTDMLEGRPRAKGDRVDDRRFKGIDHPGIVAAGQPVALPWLAARLR